MVMQMHYIVMLYIAACLGKSKPIPLQVWTGPESSSRLRLLELQDNRYKKVVRLSAQHTGSL